MTPERQRDAASAFACAEAFRRLAEPFLARIGVDVKERTESTPANLGDLVAAAANLAFAIELYIKALLDLLRSDVPQIHDLGKLYASLPLPAQAEIEGSYESWRKEWYGKRASITIAKGPTAAPEWDDTRAESHGLASVLERSGDVFSSWRYIYEFTQPTHGSHQFHRFEYGLLLSACRAIRSAVDDRLQNPPEQP